MKLKFTLLRRTCRQAVALLVAREDRSLSLPDAVALRLHLLACKACPKFETQIITLRMAMRRWPGLDASRVFLYLAYEYSQAVGAYLVANHVKLRSVSRACAYFLNLLVGLPLVVLLFSCTAVSGRWLARQSRYGRDQNRGAAQSSCGFWRYW